MSARFVSVVSDLRGRHDLRFSSFVMCMFTQSTEIFFLHGGSRHDFLLVLSPRRLSFAKIKIKHLYRQVSFF